MADLDSFFAKKDKRKGKFGKKFTPEEIAKRLETTEKKCEKTVHVSASESARRPEEVVTLSDIPTTNNTPPASEAAVEVEPPPKEVKPQVSEEEQWNDFKDDSTVDVSNLRITKLNIEEEEEGRAGGGDGGDEGRESGSDDKKDGVWKVEEQKSIQSTICEAVDAGLDEGLEEVKATVAAMNANSRFNAQKELQPSPLPRGIGASMGGGARRKKAAPDINNAMAFPSLADAQAAGNRKTKDDMIEHRGGSSSTGGSSLRNLLAAREQGGSGGAYKPPMMRTSNRYGALTDQSSRHS